jgi:hypothetical protein
MSSKLTAWFHSYPGNAGSPHRRSLRHINSASRFFPTSTRTGGFPPQPTGGYSSYRLGAGRMIRNSIPRPLQFSETIRSDSAFTTTYGPASDLRSRCVFVIGFRFHGCFQHAKALIAPGASLRRAFAQGGSSGTHAFRSCSFPRPLAAQ